MRSPRLRGNAHKCSPGRSPKRYLAMYGTSRSVSQPACDRGHFAGNFSP